MRNCFPSARNCSQFISVQSVSQIEKRVNSKNSKISTLDKTNIVCGRGKGYDDFPGNKFFRNLIQEYATMYLSTETSRSEKSVVIRTIAARLKNSGNNFVRQNNNYQWISIEEKEINNKIGHALRDIGAIRKKQSRSRQRKLAKRVLRNMLYEGRVCVSQQDTPLCCFGPTFVDEPPLAASITLGYASKPTLRTEESIPKILPTMTPTTDMETDMGYPTIPLTSPTSTTVTDSCIKQANDLSPPACYSPIRCDLLKLEYEEPISVNSSFTSSCSATSEDWRGLCDSMVMEV